MPKQQSKAGRPKKEKPSTVRVQAVLNREYFQEADAIWVIENFCADWSDRKMITEALIALGEKIGSGWQPHEVPSTITIKADVAAMLERLNAVIQMLANMDINALREVQGFDESTYKAATTGASKLISGDTRFDDKEDW